MRKRDRKAFNAYCRDLADKLELRDWTVRVVIAEPEDPNHPDGWKWHATSESTPGRKFVTLTFAEDLRDWTPESIRQTVAHELIHAHLAPLMELLRVDLYDHLKRQAYDLFTAGATRWLEYAVEGLADAVDQHLPLIEWPEAKR